jgi:hypothetical protein
LQNLSEDEDEIFEFAEQHLRFFSIYQSQPSVEQNSHSGLVFACCHFLHKNIKT